MAVESISELARCTDIEELTAQSAQYGKDIKSYCATNPLCAAIVLKMHIDPEMQRFMALMAVDAVLSVRIKELEKKQK